VHLEEIVAGAEIAVTSGEVVGVCGGVCLFVIILHSAAGGHGISRTYFLPASSIT